MSNNDEAKIALKKIFDDVNTASLYFRFLESQYIKEEKRIKEVVDMIDVISPILKQQSQGGVFESILRSMTSMSRKYNDSFQLLHYILEILTLKIQGLEYSQSSVQVKYNPQERISEEDRKALDWIKKYIEHTREGEDVGQ